MSGMRLPLGISLLLACLLVSPLHAGSREHKIVESAAGVVQGLSVIPWGLLHDAAGVAIIPHAVKAALLADGEFGRGVILLHEPDGRWSNPIFITLKGGGIGGQAGIETTELVLVFKTKRSVDRVLQGKHMIGEEATIAAGPIGRQVETATEGRLTPEIYSYSRSRGLFVGLSLERARLQIDAHSNKSFYGLREGGPGDVLARRGPPIPDAEVLKARLLGLRMPTAPPPVVVPIAPQPFPPRRR